jgi:hypothetical protein
MVWVRHLAWVGVMWSDAHVSMATSAGGSGEIGTFARGACPRRASGKAEPDARLSLRAARAALSEKTHLRGQLHLAQCRRSRDRPGMSGSDPPASPVQVGARLVSSVEGAAAVGGGPSRSRASADRPAGRSWSRCPMWPRCPAADHGPDRPRACRARRAARIVHPLDCAGRPGAWITCAWRRGGRSASSPRERRPPLRRGRAARSGRPGRAATAPPW